jgi:hypothetical protein
MPTRARITLSLAGALLLAACGADDEPVRLRVANVGAVPIRDLTVMFPDERVSFGDVPAGATTAYEDVHRGVYLYAAYRFERDGALISQPVIDWVGEEPLPGEAFTYSLALEGSRVELVGVTRDE